MIRVRWAVVLPATLLALWVGGCVSSQAPRAGSSESEEEHGTLTPQRDPGDSERLARETRSDLANVDRLLAEAGDDADADTLHLVRNLAERSRAALANDDLDLARNLARKARTLAEDL